MDKYDNFDELKALHIRHTQGACTVANLHDCLQCLVEFRSIDRNHKWSAHCLHIYAS